MNVDLLKDKIRNCGLKCTATRLAVLEYLVTVHRPVSTQEIIQNLKETAINEVTIYRILESFVEKKLITPVDHWNRHRLYEAHMEKSCQVNHAHFSCQQCETVLCIEENTLQISTIPLPPGFQLKQVRLQIEGICPNCIK
ncbi:MAG: transcriptional repressor [SAR324 cluster bacterium]|nr:transcriptional repressor [SAR324 cluster bacterium]